jgi:ornithine cyclodeaminase/alanine dehydrogenase-like protein (mu-crystallin family)
MRMLMLSGEDVRRAVPMASAIEAVAAAFAELADGQAALPLRTRVDMPTADGLALFMPAYLAGSGALGLKALTLFARNPTVRSLPSIAALVLLFDAGDGRPLALMDGGYLTALRTGAASGLATRLLARDGARGLALFGAGAQALAQVWAVCEARPIERVWLVNRTREHAERLADALRSFGPPIPGGIQIAADAASALAEADVVCCATSSPTPLFADDAIRAGTHINGIGAFLPTMQEVPVATVARARVVVDQRAAAWAEAGDLIIPREQGLIKEGHVVAELGEVVLGRVPGRTDAGEITLFKSVGLAVQDVAVARVAYKRARALGLGSEFDLGA